MANDDTWLTNPLLVPKVAKRCEGEHASRQAECKSYLRAYYDRAVISVDYTRPYRELAVFQKLRESAGGNLTREVVDAAAAIICRPLAAEVLPRGAEFELGEGCKQASRLIEGVYDNGDFPGIATRAFKDGCTADVGPVKGYIDPLENEIRFERVNPMELYWVHDGTDDPRTMMTISPVPRDALEARYPQHREKLKRLKQWSPASIVGVDAPGALRGREADTVKVIEIWCRAFGEDNPGRHCVATEDATLEDEEWPHSITPIFSFKWQPDFTGYAGVQLARIVGPYDSANRRLLRMVYAGLAGAMPQLLEHEDAETDGPSDMEYGRWKWSGPIKPEIVMPKAVSPDVLEQIRTNKAWAFSEGGVNQNIATGGAPAQYRSGAAQREFVDIANTRLLDAQKRWEKFWTDGAKVVVMLAQQARKTHVRVKGADYYESVSFPKLSRDKYRVSFGLVSGLSLTPSGRLEELNDLKEGGYIDAQDVLRHLGLPDTRQLADRVNAPRDLVMKQIGMALDHGIFTMPSALQGDQLPALVRIGGEEYQRARLQGNYPPAHLETLRRLILAAKARIAPEPAAQPAQSAQPPAQNQQSVAPPNGAPAAVAVA